MSNFILSTGDRKVLYFDNQPSEKKPTLELPLEAAFLIPAPEQLIQGKRFAIRAQVLGTLGSTSENLSRKIRRNGPAELLIATQGDLITSHLQVAEFPLTPHHLKDQIVERTALDHPSYWRLSATISPAPESPFDRTVLDDLVARHPELKEKLHVRSLEMRSGQHRASFVRLSGNEFNTTGVFLDADRPDVRPQFVTWLYCVDESGQSGSSSHHNNFIFEVQDISSFQKMFPNALDVRLWCRQRGIELGGITHNRVVIPKVKTSAQNLSAAQYETTFRNESFSFTPRELAFLGDTFAKDTLKPDSN